MATENPRGVRRKVPATDFASAEAILQAAALLIVPDDQTQRQAFERLMPQLYVLKNKGCSFLQIADLLAQVGFKLQPSAVRVYYNEILAARMEMCQSRMNEQILLLAEVRKETKGMDIADIGNRVAAIMNKQRAQVASKLDSVFGVAPVFSLPAAPVPVTPISPPPPSAVEPEAAKLPRAENKKTGLPPAPQSHAQSAPTNEINVAPVIEVGKPSKQMKYRCAALPDGVIPLKTREGMTEAFYLPGDLEHAAVSGVMLSLEQRLSSVALEFVNTEDGEIRIETADEKRFRVLWRTPIPMSKSMTGHNFTTIDESLFSRS